MKRILRVIGENDPDLFPRVASIMRECNIQIFGHAGISDNGREMLSLLVARPEEAKRAIENKQFLVRIQEWVTAQVADHPGHMADVLEPLLNQNVNIYSSFQYQMKESSGLVMETSDPQRVLQLLGGYEPELE